MSEETNEVVATPVFTSEQRLTVRETQYQAAKLREQAMALQNRASGLDKSIVDFINKSAADMQVDPTKFTFDMDGLNFIRIEK